VSLFFDRPDFGERAVLVHLKLNSESEPEDVGEFEELVRSAGGDVVELIRGSRNAPHAKFFVGTGKLDEIAEVTKRECAGADYL
jgi:GTP-binding protein HflX